MSACSNSMALVSNTNIVEGNVHSNALPGKKKDSHDVPVIQGRDLQDSCVEQRQNNEYDMLLSEYRERISTYEQEIVDLKCELAKMKGKEDEYKLQIRKLTKERNDCKCVPDEQSTRPSRSQSFETNTAQEELCKSDIPKRRDSRINCLVGNLLPAEGSVVRRSLRRSVNYPLTKRCHETLLNLMYLQKGPSENLLQDECASVSSTRQNSDFEIGESESLSKVSSPRQEDFLVDDSMVSNLDLNDTYEVSELETHTSMNKLMWKHALDMDRSEILLREELIRSVPR